MRGNHTFWIGSIPIIQTSKSIDPRFEINLHDIPHKIPAWDKSLLNIVDRIFEGGDRGIGDFFFLSTSDKKVAPQIFCWGNQNIMQGGEMSEASVVKALLTTVDDRC